MARSLHRVCRGTLSLLLASGMSTGCVSSFARRATEETGCDEPVGVTDVREEGGVVSWTASCDGASYRCQALRFDESSATYDVTCEYVPICGNDGYHDTASATVER